MSFSVVAVLEPGGLPLTDPLVAVAAAALGFESVKAVRVGGGCSGTFLPVTLILHTEPCCSRYPVELF